MQQSESINQEQQKRRRTAVLPKRSWIQRNPRVFSICFITTSLLIFFSKPIYDGFIADQLPPREEYKSRRTHNNLFK